jgi:proteasome lid subunit RPN8/RPN11
MSWLWSRAPRADRVARAALQRLRRRLAKEKTRQITALSRFARDPTRLESLFGPLKLMAEAECEIARTLQKACEGQAVETGALLRQLSGAVTEALKEEPWDNFHARRALNVTLEQLLAAQESMLEVPEPRPTAAKKRRVVISEELLRESYDMLFPAERMLVVAGQRIGEVTRLTDVFDVTGDQSGGHVRANPTLLARALIGMDQSNTFLAAWVHSHPGLGAEATRPSPIDLRQHRDWIQHYSPSLLSIIVVKDRWVRFWGTGLETAQIEVELTDKGLITENKHGYVYRLEEQRLPDRSGHADTAHRERDGTAATSEA